METVYVADGDDISTVDKLVKQILKYGEDHVGGMDGAIRHAQSVIDRCKRDQCFRFATQQQVAAAQAAVNAA